MLTTPYVEVADVWSEAHRIAAVLMLVFVRGVDVGRFVGLFVGDFVGLFVGGLVGLLVGDLVGLFVGDLVGLFVGDLVGLIVGDLVGLSVGDFVGAAHASEEDDPSGLEKPIKIRRTTEQKGNKTRHP